MATYGYFIEDIGGQAFLTVKNVQWQDVFTASHPHKAVGKAGKAIKDMMARLQAGGDPTDDPDIRDLMLKAGVIKDGDDLWNEEVFEQVCEDPEVTERNQEYADRSNEISAELDNPDLTDGERDALQAELDEIEAVRY